MNFVCVFINLIQRIHMFSTQNAIPKLKWVVDSWAKLETTGVRKAAKRLGMTADPGPIILGYVDEHFQDLEPS